MLYRLRQGASIMKFGQREAQVSTMRAQIVRAASLLHNKFEFSRFSIPRSPTLDAR